MSTHVSQLVLDELASEVPAPPEAQAHVNGCAECTAKLAAIRSARTQSAQSFGYSRVKARITAERPSRLRELMPFLVPVLAAALFFVVASFTGGTPPTERVKGAAFIDFVVAGKTVTEARPGDALTVKLGSGGFTHALVLAVDKDRHVEVLSEGLADIPVNVTPGSVTVHAFFSNAPIEAKGVVPAMQAAIAEYAGWPLEAPPPKLDGVTVVSERLYVKP